MSGSRNRLAVWAISLCFGCASLAHSADKNGEFSVRGAGLLSCETYLVERNKRSEAYNMIGGWMDGYLTALNQASPATYDMTSYQSTEMLAGIVARHCTANPQHRLFAVVGGVLKKLEPQRLAQASPRQRVVVGDQETILYQETVAKMQTRLAQRHYLLLDQVNGVFNRATARALEQFQATLGFDETGFPDQSTLWHLFDTPQDKVGSVVSPGLESNG